MASNAVIAPLSWSTPVSAACTHRRSALGRSTSRSPDDPLRFPRLEELSAVAEGREPSEEEEGRYS